MCRMGYHLHGEDSGHTLETGMVLNGRLLRRMRASTVLWRVGTKLHQEGMTAPNLGIEKLG